MEMEAAGRNDDEVRAVSAALPFVGPRFWAGVWLGIVLGSIFVTVLTTAILLIAART